MTELNISDDEEDEMLCQTEQAAQRKGFLLKEKTALLRRKNQSIQEKVRNARRRHETLELMAGAHMLMQLSGADERRSAHLEKVRRRAQKSRSFLASHIQPVNSDDAVDGIDGSGGVQRCPDLVWSIQKVQEERPALRHLKREIWPQKARNRLLAGAVAYLGLKKHTVELINNILAQKYSFSEAVDLLESLEVAHLKNVLLLFFSSLHGYRWFLYSIVLMADFHDSRSSDQNSHPGFNINTADTDPISTHLPVLLFQLLTRVFFLLRECLVNNYAPFSIQRLRLARLWRYYHFLFPIYKLKHRHALKEIAKDALDITNTQQRIMISYQWNTGQLSDPERESNEKIQHATHRRSHYFERTLFSLGALRRVFPPSYIRIGVSGDDVIRDIRGASQVCRLLALKSKITFDPEIFDQQRTHQHYLCILVGTKMFCVPPGVSVEKWRKFWWTKYEKELISEQNAPAELRSGFLARKMSPTLSGAELGEIFRPLPLPNSSRRLVLGLQRVIASFIEFCKFAGETKEADAVQQNLAELRSSCSLTDLDENHACLTSYLRLLVLLLVQISDIADCDGFGTRDLLDAELDNVRIADICSQAHSAVCVRWGIVCHMTAEEFVTFENLLQYSSTADLRRNLGNDVLQLRFLDFYHFLYAHVPGLTGCFDYLSGVVSTEHKLELKRATPDAHASQFFRNALFGAVSRNLHEIKAFRETRLFSGVLERINNVSRQLKGFFLASSICLVLGAGPAAALAAAKATQGGNPEFELKKFVTSAPLSDFQKQYATLLIDKFFRGEASVLTQLNEKFSQLFCQPELPTAQLAANFRFFAQNFAAIHAEMLQICAIFYRVNYPVLNSIFKDLGVHDSRLARLAR